MSTGPWGASAGERPEPDFVRDPQKLWAQFAARRPADWLGHHHLLDDRGFSWKQRIMAAWGLRSAERMAA
jgi:hypothetical protein